MDGVDVVELHTDDEVLHQFAFKTQAGLDGAGVHEVRGHAGKICADKGVARGAAESDGGGALHHVEGNGRQRAERRGVQVDARLAEGLENGERPGGRADRGGNVPGDGAEIIVRARETQQRRGGIENAGEAANHQAARIGDRCVGKAKARHELLVGILNIGHIGRATVRKANPIDAGEHGGIVRYGGRIVLALPAEA